MPVADSPVDEPLIQSEEDVEGGAVLGTPLQKRLEFACEWADSPMVCDPCDERNGSMVECLRPIPNTCADNVSWVVNIALFIAKFYAW